MTPSFKDRHPELQHLVREHDLLRRHNLQFKDGDSQDQMLMFAEAALIFLVLERFLRAILGDAQENESLYNLLQRAASRGLIRVPWSDQEEGIRKIKNLRNTMLHGDYETAARHTNCATVTDYFKTQFASEVEGMYKIADYIFRQISIETGKPVGK